MIATQPVSEEGAAGEWRCREVAPVDQWTLQGFRSGLAVVMVGRGERSQAANASSCLSFIDTQIVRKILLSNETATETFRSWHGDLK